MASNEQGGPQPAAPQVATGTKPAPGEYSVSVPIPVMEGRVPDLLINKLAPPSVVPPTLTAAEIKPGWRALPPEALPSPTYFPIVMALGITFIAWGVVTSWIVAAVGLVLFIVALGGWIGEMRRGH